MSSEEFVIGVLSGSIATAGILYYAWQHRNRDKFLTLEKSNIELRSELKYLREQKQSLAESLNQSLDLKDNLKHELENELARLSQNALEKNSKMFLNLAEAKFDQHEVHQSKLSNMFEPISQMLASYQEQINKLNQNNQHKFSDISHILNAFKENHANLLGETSKLTQILGHNKLRGDWGEQSLLRILEESGLKSGIDFNLKEKQADGSLPDCVVKLPNNKQVIIDAKFNAENYIKALNTEDQKTKQSFLNKHYANLKMTINQLAAKKYSEQSTQSLAFTIMFIPTEGILHSALEHDPAILNYAMKKNVILASPYSLFALLKTIATGWQEFKLADNISELRKLSIELIKRLHTLNEHFGSLGQSLNTSVENYNKLVSSYENRFVKQLDKFKDIELISTDKSDDLSKGLQVVEVECKTTKPFLKS
jgi:DNA recombination protein RmuC